MENWGTMWVGDTREVNRQIIGRLSAVSSSPMRGMNAYRAILRVEPYPGCGLYETLRLPVYQYRDEQFRTVTGLVKHDQKAKLNYILFQAYGFQSPTIRLKYFTAEGEGPFELPGTLDEDRFYYTRPSCKKPVVAFEVKDGDSSPVLFGGPML
jgi:hypothetical protein